MKSRINGGLVFSLALTAFILAMLIVTFQFPPLLRYTPFIAGGLTLLFLAVLLAGAAFPRVLTWTESTLQDTWGGSTGREEMAAAEETPSPWPSVLRVMAYAVGYLLAVYFLGFFLVTPLFLAAYLILDAGVRPVAAIAVSFGLSALMMVALVNLNVDLWAGVAPEIVPDYVGGSIQPQF